MNRTASTLLAAALLSALATAGLAGVDEPSTVREVRRTNPSTSLNEDGVRPLDGSRKPVPSIEHDVVLPDARKPRQTRSADDEVVRPGKNTFKPERFGDDGAGTARKPAAKAPKPAATVKRAPGADRGGQAVSEDPASRANEASRPPREGRIDK
jgi:hypothetical protein